MLTSLLAITSYILAAHDLLQTCPELTRADQEVLHTVFGLTHSVVLVQEN